MILSSQILKVFYNLITRAWKQNTILMYESASYIKIIQIMSLVIFMSCLSEWNKAVSVLRGRSHKLRETGWGPASGSSSLLASVQSAWPTGLQYYIVFAGADALASGPRVSKQPSACAGAEGNALSRPVRGARSPQRSRLLAMMEPDFHHPLSKACR